jgi:hypothetical protein
MFIWFLRRLVSPPDPGRGGDACFDARWHRVHDRACLVDDGSTGGCQGVPARQIVVAARQQINDGDRAEVGGSREAGVCADPTGYRRCSRLSVSGFRIVVRVPSRRVRPSGGAVAAHPGRRGQAHLTPYAGRVNRAGLSGGWLAHRAGGRLARRDPAGGEQRDPCDQCEDGGQRQRRARPGDAGAGALGKMSTASEAAANRATPSAITGLVWRPRAAGRPGEVWCRSVAMDPSATAFTRMPRGP